MELHAAGDLTEVVARISTGTLVMGFLLFVAGIVFAVVEHIARRGLREKGEDFARAAFGQILELAEGILPEQRESEDGQRSTGVVAELRELRLTSGEIMDGWARAANQPGLAPRLIVAAVVIVALAAAMVIALLAFEHGESTSSKALSGILG